MVVQKIVPVVEFLGCLIMVSVSLYYSRILGISP
jgi:hypothetical protein